MKLDVIDQMVLHKAGENTREMLLFILYHLHEHNCGLKVIQDAMKDMDQWHVDEAQRLSVADRQRSGENVTPFYQGGDE